MMTLLMIAGLLVVLIIAVILSLNLGAPRHVQSLAPQQLPEQVSIEPAAEAIEEAVAPVTDDVMIVQQAAPQALTQTDAVVQATAIPAPSKPQSQPQFATQPVCFTGDPDYVYDNAQFSIQIKQVSETGIVYFVCDIQAPDPTSAIKVGLSGDTLYGSKEHTSDIAFRNGAVLAINGDCYSFHKYGTIIRNGQLVRANKTTRHMLTLDAQGNLAAVVNRKGEDPKALGDSLIADGITQAWEFGPALVIDGQATVLDETFDLLSLRDNALEPRTVLGQIAEGHYVVIVVDGRRTGYSDGVSLHKLQELCLNTGAQLAFNLDGGGSTTLYLDGKIINKPSGGSERSVSDIIYF